MASSSEQFSRAYKPGGTMMALSGHITSSKIDESTDKKDNGYGYTLLKKREIAVFIVSAYRVT